MAAWPQPGEQSGIRIDGPAGELDALVAVPDQPPRSVAVVCHPHPQHGGTKDNKVTNTLARAAGEAGCAAVRFDFRGVGDSDGSFDDGRGELQDALAVVRWAQAASGCERVVLAGFSFGAAIALRAAAALAPAALVTVALPTRYFDDAIEPPGCPWLAVHGDADEIADPAAARRALGALDTPPEQVVLSGAGHFFHGRLSELRAAVADHLRDWLAD